MTATDLALLLTAVSGLLLGLLTWWRQRRVDRIGEKAGAQIAVLEGYDELVHNMSAQISSLSERLEECEIVKASLEERIRTLIREELRAAPSSPKRSKTHE